jgi:hypothetical protein
MLQDQALRKIVVPTGTIFPSYENSLTVDLGSEVRATVKYLSNVSLGINKVKSNVPQALFNECDDVGTSLIIIDISERLVVTTVMFSN